MDFLRKKRADDWRINGTIGGDIVVTVTAGPPDTVTVKIPTTYGSGGKLFARLSATEN